MAIDRVNPCSITCRCMLTERYLDGVAIHIPHASSSFCAIQAGTRIHVGTDLTLTTSFTYIMHTYIAGIYRVHHGSQLVDPQEFIRARS